MAEVSETVLITEKKPDIRGDVAKVLIGTLLTSVLAAAILGLWMGEIPDVSIRILNICVLMQSMNMLRRSGWGFGRAAVVGVTACAISLGVMCVAQAYLFPVYEHHGLDAGTPG